MVKSQSDLKAAKEALEDLHAEGCFVWIPSFGLLWAILGLLMMHVFTYTQTLGWQILFLVLFLIDYIALLLFASPRGQEEAGAGLVSFIIWGVSLVFHFYVCVHYYIGLQ